MPLAKRGFTLATLVVTIQTVLRECTSGPKSQAEALPDKKATLNQAR